MTKIKLYVYPHASPHVHDTEAAEHYYDTVPMSKEGIDRHCEIVSPEHADFFYMGQFTNNQSMTNHKPQDFDYWEGNEERHICDYEGEGGQERGAGGFPIPEWLHKSILTINGPLKKYNHIKNLFVRPTFSHLLLDIVKNRREIFPFPTEKSVGFRGYLNCNVRLLMANAIYNSTGVKHDIVMNQSWSGPSAIGSSVQQDYIDGLLRNPISLCPRGSGIDSVRLIETCFYRRVPVLISDYDYLMVGEDHYDTSFCFRICDPYMTENFFLEELYKVYSFSIDDLRERAQLARKYFDDVILTYFNDPTLYFLKWLHNERR
mgnify:CR=1 FL=1